MSSLPEGYRALVLGAHGGLGAAFLAHLQADPRCAQAVGLGRRTEPALELSDPTSIEAAAAAMKAQGPWHLIVLATGVLHGPGLRPEKRLADLEAESLRRVFEVNTVGPALVLRHFAPQLDRQRSLMGLLSAKVGSIGDNRLGGWYAYRASKAALNMMVRTAAIELQRTHKGAVLVALHPGTVSTALSEPFNGQTLGRESTVAAGEMLGVLDRLMPEDTGSFRAYDGQVLPW